MAEFLTEEDLEHCKAVAFADASRVLAIVKEVAQATGISERQILGARGSAAVTQARQIAMFVADREGIHRNVIAKTMKRDVSTVAHGVGVERARRRSAQREESPMCAGVNAPNNGD